MRRTEEDTTKENAHRTAGLQQRKPASQPERSDSKRKAKSSASRARALWKGVGRFLKDESEIDFNEYQEVTVENVQQPAQEDSMDVLGRSARKGEQNLYSITGRCGQGRQS